MIGEGGDDVPANHLSAWGWGGGVVGGGLWGCLTPRNDNGPGLAWPVPVPQIPVPCPVHSGLSLAQPNLFSRAGNT
ncbi:hypothetical protein CDL15_Pgr004056 [Punica granatum]|uniref:Uncharacterized protein n=1 Tax=Punica granatum TaxID=22663 RepID=A0A218XF95_PUNGR|nr:hypothetical protein CDL15_Pgr004056 [Punica granatum]